MSGPTDRSNTGKPTPDWSQGTTRGIGEESGGFQPPPSGGLTSLANQQRPQGQAAPTKPSADMNEARTRGPGEDQGLSSSEWLNQQRPQSDWSEATTRGIGEESGGFQPPPTGGLTPQSDNSQATTRGIGEESGGFQPPPTGGLTNQIDSAPSGKGISMNGADLGAFVDGFKRDAAASLSNAKVEAPSVDTVEQSLKAKPPGLTQ